MKRKNIMAFFMMICLAFVMLALNGCSKAEIEAIAAKSMEYSQAVSLPEQYSITYEIMNTDGIINKMTKAKDSAGNIYYRTKDKEKLFVKISDNVYHLYEKDEAGIFKLTSDWDGYTAAYIHEETKGFLHYVEASSKKSLPTIANIGESEVLGRSCDRYEITTGAGNYVVKYTLQVDSETGICMSWEKNSTVDDIHVGQEEEFQCITFQVDNIKLPEYTN